MKLLRILITLAVGIVVSVNAYAFQAGGYQTTGLLGPNAHTHVMTTPCKVYAITVIPTASNGWGAVIETNSARQDAAYSGGLVGTGFITGKHTKVKADLQSATTGNAVHFEYPDGIPIDEQMFVTSTNALIEVYYKTE